uniref:uncharacterized protein LOC105350191 n=1 Tax=Fragaria vesca subsp. vesca TaxID=101020 RepID=UPI0005CA06B4|nr:PREDICTED: uncharacterized protein LOC105350191 [Fragaria vesca subsp. vesca]
MSNLMYHKVQVKLSIFVSGFMRKIVSNFLGLIRILRGRKETMVCSIDEELNFSDADNKKSHNESSSTFIPELQIATKADESEAAEKPLIQPLVEPYYISCKFCFTSDHSSKGCPMKQYVCRECGTLFPCEKKDVHGEEHKRLNYCLGCKRWGHTRNMCSDKDNLDVNWGEIL